MKLLIIEDDKNMRKSLKRLVLESTDNAEVLESGNSEKSLKITETLKPDLILLDILIPGLNGLQVLKEIKSHREMKIRNIPVLVLTGIGDKRIENMAKKLGAEDFITKPFNEKILMMKIRKYL